MTWLDRLTGWYVGNELWTVAITAFCFLVIAAEAGYRRGRRWASHHEVTEAEISSISALTAGMLSLLAFTLALTINFAQNRFESRRDHVAHEANAIGTAWLRAGLAADPEGAALARGIHDYARLRLAYIRGVPLADEAALHARIDAAQTDLWRITTAITRAHPSPITASLVAAMNEMFDSALIQRFATESRVPVRLIFMLLAGSLLCCGATGFQLGLRGRRHERIALMLMVMWAGALMLVVDFSNPRQGALGINTTPLEWTLQGMGKQP
jgi:hypothetical protein